MTDTSPEAKRALVEIYRRMPFARKWQNIRDAFRTARVPHAVGVRLRNPAATDRDIQEEWLAKRLGDLPRKPSGDPAMFLSGDELRVFQDVVAKLTALGVPYANDLLSVYKVQLPPLDQDYLDRWAAHLGVADLLARARQEGAV
jgi:hypothetical protein